MPGRAKPAYPGGGIDGGIAAFDRPVSDSADAIGGWATAGVGQKYGSGYGIKVKARWQGRIVDRMLE